MHHMFTRARAVARRRRRSAAQELRFRFHECVFGVQEVLFRIGDRAVAVTERSTGRRMGTRRRALAMITAGFAALASMFTLVSANAMAVNFSSSDTSYKVFTDRVAGGYAAGYLNEQATSAGKKSVMQIGFKTAALNGLCAIATQSLPTLGSVSIMIVAGEPVNGTVTAPADQTIQANWLYLASNLLTGNGDQISKMNLGQSADTLMTDQTAFKGAVGGFGLQAEVMNISNLNTDSYGIGLEGQINLPNLKIKVLPGTKTYADCAGA